MLERWVTQIENGFRPFMEVDYNHDRIGIFKYLFRILFILLIHFGLSYFFQFVGYQPDTFYYEPTIIGGFVNQLFNLRYGLPVLICVSFLILYRNHLLVTWVEFERGHSLRVIIFLIAAILTWKYSFYDYNLFYDRGHFLDRVILISLALFILLRPIFIMPFLLMLKLVINQFENISGFSWAEPSLPMAILTLFLAFCILYFLSRKFILKDFLLILICLLASHYWLSGLGKMNIPWLTDDRLAYLIPSSYANGWLKFLSQDEINSFMSIMDGLNIPLKIMTLVLEFGSMFILVQKRMVRLFIFGWILMHVGIFFNTGICFWVWSLVDLIVLIFFLKKDNLLSKISFTRVDIVLGILLIVGGSFWNRIVKLSWYDTPLSYVYQYEATNLNGDTIHIPHHFFAPYDYQFTINNFSYLCDWSLLNIGKSPEIMQKLKVISSSSEFFNYESKKGVNQYNDKKTRQFKNFLLQYIRNWNKRKSNEIIFSRLEAPRLLWTYPLDFEPDEIDSITSIRVLQVTVFYLNGKCEEFRKKTVFELSISD